MAAVSRCAQAADTPWRGKGVVPAQLPQGEAITGGAEGVYVFVDRAMLDADTRLQAVLLRGTTTRHAAKAKCHHATLLSHHCAAQHLTDTAAWVRHKPECTHSYDKYFLTESTGSSHSAERGDAPRPSPE